MQKMSMGYLNKEFVDLVGAICRRRPEDRPSIAEIRQHPWMKKDTAHEKEIAKAYYDLAPENQVAIDKEHYKAMQDARHAWNKANVGPHRGLG